MSARHLEWFASLPLTLEPAPGVLAFHGSPTDDLVYLLETIGPEGSRPATEAEVMERLGEHAGRSLLLCGHTHLQRSMRLDVGSFVVNPGSVGWPAYDDDVPFPHVMEAGTPHARYAVVDDATGRWEAEFLAIEYPWETAARIAEDNGRPDIARALLTGRV
jgi:diadenosine tetraphosphatase ApaH/serine/threonine PP2A family protein phosphatase